MDGSSGRLVTVPQTVTRALCRSSDARGLGGATLPAPVRQAIARAAVVALSAGVCLGQERPAVPAFPAQADAITADVVVLGKDDRPVRGLRREDFTLLEDGKPQVVVAFEARELLAAPHPPAPVVGDERVASNEGGTGGGRTFAFLLDDLGTAALPMEDARKAIATWLREKADPRDEVTLATSSGDLWWSDRVDRGREDLLAVLGRVQAHKLREQPWISDWEAYRITVFEDATGASAASAGGGLGESTQSAVTAGPPGGQAAGATPLTNPDVLGHIQDRVAGRTGLTPGGVRMLAMEHYTALNRRVRSLLGATERLSRGLAGASGRKSILLFSEGFLYDPNQRALFDRAIDASQRGNTALYFIDASGLAGSCAFDVDPTCTSKAGQMGVVSMEVNYLEASGTELIAESTGGRSIRSTNDLLDGLTRVTEESSTYYLLGYQPEKSPDGKWHKLEVKVARPGVKVKTRHGYQAALQPALEAAAPRPDTTKAVNDKKAPKRPLDPAVMTSGASDALGLRAAPYVLEAGAAGQARILVVIELDTSRLALKGERDRRTGAVDLTVLGMSRDLGKTFPLDERVQIDLPEKAVGGWMTLSREIRLPPGVAQVRVLVRDVASGVAGTVTQRLEIPGQDGPYLATPIVTDRMIAERGQAPRLMPVAHRLFRARGHLFCSYEVVGMTNAKGEATARVSGGFTLRKSDGRILSQEAPTPIAVALGGKVRRLLALPLTGLAAGEYELVLDVVDEATGRTLHSSESFALEPGVS
jgi:VWFA-related protein